LSNVQWEQDHTEAPAGVDLAGELEGEDMGVSWDGRGAAEEWRVLMEFESKCGLKKLLL
jgi:hypothetical protein